MASLILILVGVGLAVSGAVAGFSHLARPKMLEVLGRMPVKQRANLLLFWTLLPLLAGLLTATAVVTPSILSAMGLLADHCSLHGTHHSHLCLLHPGGTPAIPGTNLLLGLMGAGLLLAGAYKTRQLVGTDRRWRTLRRLAPLEPDTGIRILKSGQPVATTVGLFRPTVFLSQGLLAALSPTQKDAVAAHEAAHRHRRDPLRLVLARLACRFHFPASRRALCRELELAVERAADEVAARRVGDRIVVAEALVAVARLRPVATPGLRFAEAPLEARVQALVADTDATWRPPRGVVAPLVVLPLAVLVLSPQVHHGLETLLGYL